MLVPTKLQFQQLTGRSQDHLILSEEFGCYLHPLAESSLLQLKVRAWQDAGIDLKVASGFRSFYRQALIWEAKVTGQRPVMDRSGSEQVEVSCLSDGELCRAILRWSALPGTSRHHWGSDVDIYDQAALEADYVLQLAPWEYGESGPFYRLSQWLDEVLSEPESGWFRPFAIDKGGVGVEPWHISYAPLSSIFQAELSVEVLRKNIETSELSLKAALLADLDLIYKQYLNGDVMC